MPCDCLDSGMLWRVRGRLMEYFDKLTNGEIDPPDENAIMELNSLIYLVDKAYKAKMIKRMTEKNGGCKCKSHLP